MKRIALACVFLCSQLALGAFEREAQGCVSLGLGGACVPGAHNTWALSVNPAALGLLATRSVSVSYRPHAFGFPELALGSFMVVEPSPWGNLALSGSSFGGSIYRETSFSLAYACTVSKGVTLGAGAHAYLLGIERYGSAHTFGVDVGLSAEVTKGVQWSAAALNVNRPRLGGEGELLPQILWLSLTYEPIPFATFAADLVKDNHFPYELHIGLGYELMGMVGVRAGISSDPALQTAGIGLRISQVQFDYALSKHAQLGVTHQFSLALHFGDRHHDGENSRD
jgi:hypothetical protein